MRTNYRLLYEEIHAALVRHSSDPKEIYGAAGLVLLDVYAGLVRDAPDRRLQLHMLRQTVRFLLDEIDTCEEREVTR